MTLVEKFIEAKKFQNQLRLEALKDSLADEITLISRAAASLGGMASADALARVDFIKNNIPAGSDIVNGDLDSKFNEERTRLENERADAENKLNELNAEIASLDTEITNAQNAISDNPVNVVFPDDGNYSRLKRKVGKLNFKNKEEKEKAEKQIKKQIKSLKKKSDRLSKRHKKIKALKFNEVLINSILIIGGLCCLGLGGFVGIAIHAISTFAAVVGPMAGLGMLAIGKMVYDHYADESVAEAKKAKIKGKIGENSDLIKGLEKAMEDAGKAVKNSKEAKEKAEAEIQEKLAKKEEKINNDKPAKEAALAAAEQVLADFNNQAGQYQSDNKGYNKIKAKMNELNVDAARTGSGNNWVRHAGKVLLDKYIDGGSDAYLRGDIPFDDALIDIVYNITKENIQNGADYSDNPNDVSTQRNIGEYKTKVEDEVDNQAANT